MYTTFSKRLWLLLWTCLILLNVIIRYPITPHEIGNDSFAMHSIANSISTFGHAEWWIHPFSIVGLYPYSAASALPFYLSGASQSMHLDMEWTIWVVLLSFGIFSAFAAYLMAGAIKNDEVFKYITALVYSTSPGILIFTTWDASGRGLFMVLLPLFIYFLIKSRFFELKYGIFTVIFFLLLMATHNLIFFVIPIIISFGIALTIKHIPKSKYMAMPITIQKKQTNIFLSMLLLIIFIIVFVESFIIFSDMAARQTHTLTAVDSISAWFTSVGFSYARYIGVLGIFAIVGFMSLLVRHDKSFEEWFLVLLILFLIPLLPAVTYAKYFILPFAALLISDGITSLITGARRRKTTLFMMVIFLVLSVGIAEFYQFGRTNISCQTRSNAYWAEENTVTASAWIKAYTNKPVYSDSMVLSRRVLAFSETAMLSETNVVNIIQGNVNKDGLIVSMRSPILVTFYSQGPFKIENASESNWCWYKLRRVGYDSKWGKRIISKFNLNYYIRNERINYNIFSASVDQQKHKFYDNGDVSIWDLEQSMGD